MTSPETATPLDEEDVAEKRTLKWLLGINFSQVLVAGTVGIVAESTGLLGAALDNLADAAVYIVSLYAVGRALADKARAARLSGVLLIALALGLFVEVIRRFLGASDPIGLAMIVTAIANAATNFVGLRLLRSHRDRGVHLKASWIFTSNDMIVNFGIALSGVAVMVLNSPYPDLLIGLIMVAIIIKGGREILENANNARHAAGPAADGHQPPA